MLTSKFQVGEFLTLAVQDHPIFGGHALKHLNGSKVRVTEVIPAPETIGIPTEWLYTVQLEWGDHISYVHENELERA